MDIAIVVVAYNRIQSLKRLLNSLKKAEYLNHNVTLIISVDKSDNNNVYNFASEIEWPHGEKKVIKHRENLGLKKHVLKCGDLVSDYDAIIMLEDDLFVSKSFYLYSLKTLNFYKEDARIAGISLYSYRVIDFSSQRTFIPLHDGSDVYFMQVPSSWGQLWTRKQWKEFRSWLTIHKNKLHEYKDLIPDQAYNWGDQSWKRLFYMYIVKENKYIVYPRIALSTNMGEIGTHNKYQSSTYQVDLINGIKEEYNLVSLDDSKSKYNGFFESQNFGEYLKLNKLVVDYYKLKNESEIAKSRYLITTENLNKKVIKSWGLNLVPYELNIIENIPGTDIYLYDMSVSENKRNTKNADVKITLYELPGIAVRKSSTLIKIKMNRLYSFITRKIRNLL